MQDPRYKAKEFDNKTLLIIAASGRMLAQSAIRAGLTPVVIDLFGDLDTCALAAEVQVVDALTVSALSGALDFLSERHDFLGAVYGSGLENHPESLEYLSRKLSLFGNTPETFRRVHDKRDFFAVLQRLGLAYPETLFTPPKTPDCWLCKPYRGQGGAGIYFSDQVPAKTAAHCDLNVYWQRYLSGEPLSALLLADGKSAQIFGFNRQWLVASAGCPFAFSGVSTYKELPAPIRHRLNAQLQLLTLEYSLAGLNSVDFIWDGRQVWILEINPRPPASLALYDVCYSDGLLATHLAACRGTMPALECLDRSDAAYRILFAQRDCLIPGGLIWPDWATDRPQPNSRIRAGQPICSIMARCTSAQQAIKLLHDRAHFIFNLLQASNEHAIHSER